MADEERKALIGTGIESVPKSTPEIGIDTDEHFADTIIDAAETSQLDLGQIESFTTVAQNFELSRAATIYGANVYAPIFDKA